MKRIARWGAVLLLLGTFGGCGSARDVQELAYVTAVGIDYEEDRYVVYAQVLNFTSLARTENVEIGKSIPVWSGKGEGETVFGALSDMGRTSQFQLFWGHVRVVVLSENVLKRGISDVYNAFNRYREIRYNLFIYGTKRNMLDILKQKSLLNMSPLDTMPFTNVAQRTPMVYVLPVTGHRTIAMMNEPGQPIVLPSLDLESDTWHEDAAGKEMFLVSGGYMFEGDRMAGWMSNYQLRGYRWAQPKMRSYVRIPAEGPADAVLVLSRPKLSIATVLEGGAVRFDLKLKVHGYVTELIGDVSEPRLQRLAAEALREDIAYTYSQGVKLRCDPFGLRHALYRIRPAAFHRLKREEGFFLRPDSLRHIRVDVRMTSMGKYKGRNE